MLRGRMAGGKILQCDSSDMQKIRLLAETKLWET